MANWRNIPRGANSPLLRSTLPVYLNTGLPVQVRDQILKMGGDVPRGAINKEYFTQNAEAMVRRSLNDDTALGLDALLTRNRTIMAGAGTDGRRRPAHRLHQGQPGRP